MQESSTVRADSRTRYSGGRRNFLRTLGKVAVGSLFAYGLSRIPLVGAQMQQAQEIDVGLLTVPVTLDGQISPGEYADCIPYQYFTYISRAGNPKGYLYTKHDDVWTYFGMNFPSDTKEVLEKYTRTFSISFNTQNQPTDASGTPGKLSFSLNFYNPKHPTETNEEAGNTYFKQAFQRGQDYDWKYFFGTNTQFEFKAKTGILTRFYPNIGIETFFGDYQGNLLAIFNPQGSPWVNMKYTDVPLPEPFVLPLILGTGAAAYFGKRAHRKSRRAFLGLPEKPRECYDNNIRSSVHSP